MRRIENTLTCAMISLALSFPVMVYAENGNQHAKGNAPGHVSAADGSVRKGDGSVKPGDGSVRSGDGSVRSGDGSVRTAGDGSVRKVEVAKDKLKTNGANAAGSTH